MSNQKSIRLLGSIRDRCGLGPDRPLRVVETRSGTLIVPLTDGPMGPDLAREVEEWQSLGEDAWEGFPYVR